MESISSIEWKFFIETIKNVILKCTRRSQ